MSHRCLTEIDARACPELFYRTALQYGHYLWQQGHAGRSILAITRALYSDLSEDAATLEQWPLPYRALQWIINEHDSDHFPGNPRISFQHQATRLRGERQELRRARAWAVWAVIRTSKPSLTSDTCQLFTEPTLDEIETGLKQHGHNDEAALWKSVIQAD